MMEGLRKWAVQPVRMMVGMESDGFQSEREMEQEQLVKQKREGDRGQVKLPRQQKKVEGQLVQKVK